MYSIDTYRKVRDIDDMIDDNIDYTTFQIDSIKKDAIAEKEDPKVIHDVDIPVVVVTEYHEDPPTITSEKVNESDDKGDDDTNKESKF